MALISCSECSVEISDKASACPRCGFPLAPSFSTQRETHERVVKTASVPSNGVAAVLSFLIPGVGQMYKGKVLQGLMWLVFTFAGYSIFILPGLILHMICVFTAYSDKADGRI